MTKRSTILVMKFPNKPGSTEATGFGSVAGPRATFVANAPDGSGTRTTQSQRALPLSTPDTRHIAFPGAAPANCPDRCSPGGLVQARRLAMRKEVRSNLLIFFEPKRRSHRPSK